MYKYLSNSPSPSIVQPSIKKHLPSSQTFNHSFISTNPTLEMSSADEQYEAQNDAVSGDVPAGDAQDNDYVSRPGQKDGPIPVQSDNTAIEDPIDGATADSDEQLGMASSLPLSSP
jgi:hypothetical protein